MLLDAHVDGTAQFQIDHVFIDGNEAAVFDLLSKKVKSTGKSFTANVCQRFTCDNGKIKRLLMLEDAAEILKAFIPTQQIL